MARNPMDKYFNQLDIRKGDYIVAIQKKYKFPRFQKCLEILKRASFKETIPPEFIEKIEKIFSLMPVHELYYVKSTPEEVNEYLKNLNDLYIKVLDDFEKYSERIPTSYWFDFSFIFYAFIFFHDYIEKTIGFNVIIAATLIMFAIRIYEYRDRFLRNPFKPTEKINHEF